MVCVKVPPSRRQVPFTAAVAPVRVTARLSVFKWLPVLVVKVEVTVRVPSRVEYPVAVLLNCRFT